MEGEDILKTTASRGDFLDCIKGKVAKGLLSQKQYDELAGDYDRAYERNRRKYGDTDAASAAASDVVAAREKVMAKETHAKVALALQGERLRTEFKDIKAKQLADYEKLNPVAKRAHRRPAMHHIVADYLQLVSDRQSAISNRMLRSIADFAEEYRSKMAGFTQSTDGLKDSIRSLLGEKVESEMANKFGGQLRDVFQRLNQMHDQAGGIMGKVENYFPQAHNGNLIAKVSMEDWRAFTMERIDPSKMYNQSTGMPYSIKDLMGKMAADYDAFVTNDLNELADAAGEGKGRVGNGTEVFKKRQERRFYQFKDADSFFEYNAKFGVGDQNLFSAIIHHVEGISRDIGLMQMMSPKPNALMANLELFTDADLRIDRHARGLQPRSYKQQLRFVRGMYDLVAGRYTVSGALPWWGKALSGTKNLVRGAALGNAAISALFTDNFYIRTASKMHGIDAGRTMKEYRRALMQQGDKEWLRRNVFTPSSVNGNTLQAAREASEYGGHGVTGWLSSLVIRSSGLNALTERGQTAARLGLAGEMAHINGKKLPWKDINPDLRNALEKFKITEADLQQLHEAKLDIDPDTKASYLFPEAIARMKPKEGMTKQQLIDLSLRYDTMMNNIGNYGVNEPSLRTRAMSSGAALGDAGQDTALHQLISSTSMIRSFSFTNMQNFVLPLMRGALAGDKRKMLLFAQMAAGMTMGGAMAIQARQLLVGKDPRDMFEKNGAPSWQFWKASVMQGGGLGLFGDFFFEERSRFGRSFGAEMAGPMVGMVDDIIKLGFGGFDAIGSNTKASIGTRAVRFTSQNFPVDTWYTQLAVQRLFLDQLERVVNPRFNSDRVAQENRMKSNFKQGYWWKRGEVLPDRAPNIKNPVGK